MHESRHLDGSSKDHPSVSHTHSAHHSTGCCSPAAAPLLPPGAVPRSLSVLSPASRHSNRFVREAALFAVSPLCALLRGEAQREG